MKRLVTLSAAVFLFYAVFTFGEANKHDLNFSVMIYDDFGQPLFVDDGKFHKITDMTWEIPGLTDDINLTQIGSAPGPMYNAMAGGDSDGDNLFELYMYIKDNVGGWTYTYRIYENDGAGNYDEVFNAGQGMIPYAYGDTDGDNLPEVIGQWSSWVYVWESPAQGELAANLVWTSPQIFNVTGYTTTGDLDNDGNQEIIHSNNSFGSSNLVIYENTGDNQYSIIYDQLASSGSTGEKVIGDFDNDGMKELVFSSGNGELIVIEATGNNSFQEVFRTQLGFSNAYACELGNDLNSNGRLEFIVSGSSGAGWTTNIYESPGNNNYVLVQQIVINDGYIGSPGNTVGDLDGDGVDEIVIQTAQAIHLYKWNGFEFALEGTIPENFGSILHGTEAYDGNFNGYDEVFWLGLGDGGYWTNETVILENEDTGPPPDVTVSLTPINPPIVIPAGGGSFDYTVEITNNETDPVVCDVNLQTQLPNGSLYNIATVYNITLPANGTVTRQKTQVVPENAPAGEYVYWIRIGEMPDDIWDTDEFGFVKE